MSIPVKSPAQPNLPPRPRPVLSADERAALERQWREENAEAIRLENEDVEKNGLPLAQYRLF